MTNWEPAAAHYFPKHVKYLWAIALLYQLQKSILHQH